MKNRLQKPATLTLGLLVLAGCGGATAASLSPSRVTVADNPPGYTQETINPEATYITPTTAVPLTTVTATTADPPTTVAATTTTTTTPPPPPLPADLLFDPKSAELKGDPSSFLNPVVAVLQQRPELRLQIVGYTDSDGHAFNAELSLLRSEAVKAWLVSQGIESDRLTTIGMGEANPIGDNSTAEGKSKNRRVELKYM